MGSVTLRWYCKGNRNELPEVRTGKDLGNGPGHPSPTFNMEQNIYHTQSVFTARQREPTVGGEFLGAIPSLVSDSIYAGKYSESFSLPFRSLKPREGAAGTATFAPNTDEATMPSNGGTISIRPQIQATTNVHPLTGDDDGRDNSGECQR